MDHRHLLATCGTFQDADKVVAIVGDRNSNLESDATAIAARLSVDAERALQSRGCNHRLCPIMRFPSPLLPRRDLNRSALVGFFFLVRIGKASLLGLGVEMTLR